MFVEKKNIKPNVLSSFLESNALFRLKGTDQAPLQRYFLIKNCLEPANEPHKRFAYPACF